MAGNEEVVTEAVVASLKEHADKLTGKGPKHDRITDQ
jgi:hypothetical protein